MAKKKSINPFKLWGSYVGFLIIATITIIISATGYNICSDTKTEFIGDVKSESVDCYLNMFQYGDNAPISVGAFINGVLGFLLGWGLHLLIQKVFR